MNVGSFLLDLMFPPKCAICGKLLKNQEKNFCTACRENMPCAGEETRHIEYVKSVSPALYYEGEIRQAMLRYKFQGASALGVAFGTLIAERVLKDGIRFDLLTWVPLSKQRKRKRGYDQAQILAEEAAKHLGCTAVPLLKKIRNIAPQSGISGESERKAHVSGCYEVRTDTDIKGRTILIIDDIITTGSTVSECARMLLLGGAEEIYAASAACRRTQ